MLQILSICFLSSESSPLLSITNIILRQCFWDGAKKMRQRRSPMYLVQLGKLEQSSKSKLMSRFWVLTMQKPQVYFFWQRMRRPEQFSCQSAASMWISIFTLVVKRIILLSFQKRRSSYFQRRGSSFIIIAKFNLYLDAWDMSVVILQKVALSFKQNRVFPLVGLILDKMSLKTKYFCNKTSINVHFSFMNIVRIYSFQRMTTYKNKNNELIL